MADEAKHFLDCDEKTFNLALAARFPENYGRVKLLSKRFSYPLSLQHAHKYYCTRIALIADAAPWHASDRGTRSQHGHA